MIVSILVLVEAGLRLKIIFLISIKFFVSILVLVEAGLRQNISQYIDIMLQVSILVLVEAGLRLVLRHPSKIPMEEFQSLFWWKRASDLTLERR